jgi:glycosyltransferase involved in cell wall biosynthesis
MIQYTLNANLGVTLDKPGNPNYENSLPNKIFDYAFSGIPVLGSNLKEVSRVINDYQIGSIVDSVNPESIANALNYFFLNKSFYNFCKQNTQLLKEKLSWEKESEKLIEIIRKLD